MQARPTFYILLLLLFTYISLPPAYATTAEEHFEKGNILYHKGFYDEAIKEYKEAIRAGMNSTLIHKNLGFIFFQKKLYDNAIMEYKKVLRTDPDDSEAMYFLEFSKKEARKKTTEIVIIVCIAIGLLLFAVVLLRMIFNLYIRKRDVKGTIIKSNHNNTECPFCKEDIKEGATKCKHCGSNLRSNSIQYSGNKKAAIIYELLLIGIPLITTLLLWFWVGYKEERFVLLCVITVFGTAFIASIEASYIRTVYNKQGSYSPTEWFFKVAILWFIGYPAYLYERRNYGLTNFRGVGIFLVILFISSALLLFDRVLDSYFLLRH